MHEKKSSFIWFVALSLIGLGLGSALVGVFILSLGFDQQEVLGWLQHPTPAHAAFLFWANLIQQTCLFGLPALGVLWYYRVKPQPHDVSFLTLRNAMWIVLWFLMALPAIDLAGRLNVHLLGYFPEFQRWAGGQEQQVLEVQRLFLSDLSPSGVAQSLFLIAMVPALMEELYFRGALQRIMGQFITNGWITIILGGLVFSLIHFQFEGFLSRWMLGSMLGWVAWKTGKIWPSVLLHFMNNALSILFFHLQGQQMNTAEDHWSQHGIVGTISLACLVMLPYTVWKKERKTNATTRAFF